MYPYVNCLVCRIGSYLPNLGEYGLEHKAWLNLLWWLKCLRLVKCIKARDLRDVEVSALVAAKMREFHNLDMPGPKTVVLWNRIRHWLNEARSLCSLEIAEEFRLDTLEEEILLLEKELSRDDQEVPFCHNDLQYGNIMMNEETRSTL